MPQFKSTYNIFKAPHEDEVFNENWMNSKTLITPPTKPWSYDREMRIEDVDIWEVICEESGGFGLYASWAPYAEFYMLLLGWDFSKPMANPTLNIPEKRIELFYGHNSEINAYRRAKEIGLPIFTKERWVEEDDLWLHHPVQILK
jgi:hypothetical protein